MITVEEILMGRDKEYPLSIELAFNLANLLARLNYLRAIYGKPLTVSSGYRPAIYNARAGGSKKSSHLTLEAADFKDSTGEFASWCLMNLNLLNSLGLYMEDPNSTIGWVHLQTRKTNNNPFRP